MHKLLQLGYTEGGTCINESKVRQMEKIVPGKQIREKDKEQVGRGRQGKHLRNND